LTPEIIATNTGLSLDLVLDVMKGNRVLNDDSRTADQVATGFGMPDNLRRFFGLAPHVVMPAPVPVSPRHDGKARINQRTHVGGRIAELRRERGLTQESLAERAGISRESVGKIERERRSPSLAMLGTLADALGVPTAELIEFSGPDRQYGAKRDRVPDYLSAEITGRPDFIAACARHDLGAIFTIAAGAGFTISHLARRCEMGVSQVTDYMRRGRNAQDAEVFCRVSDGLRIPGRMFGIGSRPWETGEPAGNAEVEYESARAEGNFGAELARLMEEKGVGVRELARRTNYTPGYISNLRHGNKAPSPKVAGLVDSALDANGWLIEIERKSARETLPGFRRKASGKPESAPGPEITANPNDYEEVADRISELVSWIETTNVGDGTLDYLDNATSRLARDCLSTPPFRSHERGSQLAMRVSGLLRSGHQHINQTRDLYVIAGKLCAVLSWVASDFGQLATAEAHAHNGWALAEQADHNGLRALLLSAQSKNAFWKRCYDDAATYARRGYEYNPPGTARVLLACQEADAMQALDRLDDAREALARAEGAQDSILLPDELGGIFACGIARQANYAIGTHLRTGSIDQALRQVERAETAWRNGEQWAYGTWAQVQIGAAIAHLMGGEIEQAAVILQKILNKPAEQRLATLKTRLARDVIPLLANPMIGASKTVLMLREGIAEYGSEQARMQSLPARGNS
jgi:transcriptional regulator with XRE-family HTH domain